MNFFDRAFKYCIRQRIKNLILFLIMTVIAVFLILSVSILKSSENATLNVKGEVNGKLHLTIDEEGNYTIFGTGHPILISSMENGSSSIRFAISLITSGSDPNNWRDTGNSSG